MIRRFLTRILLVVVIGACGYNALVTARLQGRVVRLEASLGAKRVGAATPVTDTSWLSRANACAARAGAEVARGDVAGAQRDMARGTDDIRRASREPAARSQEAVLRVSRSVRDLNRQLTQLQTRAHGLETQAGPDAKRLRAAIDAFAAQAHSLVGKP